MSKKSLLVCMPDFPFPARKNGISIRYYPILEHASKEFDIHLLIIANGNVGQDVISEAKSFCSKVSIYVRKPKYISTLSKLTARIKSSLPTNIPFEYLYFDEKEISEFIIQETSVTFYDVALCVTMIHQHLVKKYVKAKRYTLDVIDSPYSTYRRTRGKSLVKFFDSLIIRSWERHTLRNVDYACYVSPLDRNIGAGEADNDQIGVIPNGLFKQDHTEEKIEYDCNTIGYLGHMGYPPNIRAALRLYSIFKQRKNDLHNTKLVIIGRDPSDEILALAKDPDVVVTGTVDNIWRFVNGVDLFVFPMEIGSGQQNKLLEAMGAAKPVISSSLGNSGIGASSPVEIVIADTDETIGNAIKELINDQQRAKQIGENAKNFVEQRFSWNATYKVLNSTLLKVN